ncbi:OLC1v1020729C1, partial [Oldenlandia corymbosa var. corymbosa]
MQLCKLGFLTGTEEQRGGYGGFGSGRMMNGPANVYDGDGSQITETATSGCDFRKRSRCGCFPEGGKLEPRKLDEPIK